MKFAGDDKHFAADEPPIELGEHVVDERVQACVCSFEEARHTFRLVNISAENRSALMLTPKWHGMSTLGRILSSRGFEWTSRHGAKCRPVKRGIAVCTELALPPRAFVDDSQSETFTTKSSLVFNDSSCDE